jgi:hypothetical protein
LHKPRLTFRDVFEETSVDLPWLRAMGRITPSEDRSKFPRAERAMLVVKHLIDRIE